MDFENAVWDALVYPCCENRCLTKMHPNFETAKQHLSTYMLTFFNMKQQEHRVVFTNLLEGQCSNWTITGTCKNNMLRVCINIKFQGRGRVHYLYDIQYIIQILRFAQRHSPMLITVDIHIMTL
jgi:hypothetical protein